jgi:hypothetical protein
MSDANFSERLQTVECDLADLRRQYSKHFIVFSGCAVQVLPGEYPFDALRHLVWFFWGSNLQRSDVATCLPALWLIEKV